MPNSREITSVRVPAACSPSASSSSNRRRTGSPRTSNACTRRLYRLLLIYVKTYIWSSPVEGEEVLPQRQGPRRSDQVGAPDAVRSVLGDHERLSFEPAVVEPG